MADEEVKNEEVEVIPEEEGQQPDIQKTLKKLREDLKKCEMERKEYLEGWQRAKADFINYKNEEGKRFEDMARFVTGGLIQELLPVLDSFDLALGHGLPKEVERGVLLIRSQFEDILKKRGLETIKIELGEEFNPEKHESIGEVESTIPQGRVAEVVQRGYLFRERVLRPARVIISKGRKINQGMEVSQ